LPPAEKISAGLDWGNAKTAMAHWDSVLGQAQTIATPGGEPYVLQRVGVREVQENGRLVPKAFFPVTESWTQEPESYVFEELKNHLPAFGDSEVSSFLARSEFEYWHKAFPQQNVGLSISVPIEYSWENCQALHKAAKLAGFPNTAHIDETIAAVLAYLPVWRQDDVRWRLLEGGRSVWVVDCGASDLNIGLIHVRRHSFRPGQDNFEFSFLAGDRLEHYGAQFSLSPETLSGDVERA
jgi:molecular chaperone DnaK (HSP70)